MKKAKIFVPDEIEDIVARYLKMETVEKIRKYYKVRTDIIKNILIENGITIRKSSEYFDASGMSRNKKYNYDEHYFENIDSPIKAYWLGFIYADGSVNPRVGKMGGTKGGTFEFTLKESDKYVLENLRYDMNANIPITSRSVFLKETGKTYNAVRLVFSSISIVNDLIKHGCVPNKSLILNFPEHIDALYHRDFIRGYFDGDGCIRYYENRNFHMSMQGTEEFLNSVKKILEKEGIKCSSVQTTKSKVHVIQFTGRDNLSKIFDYFYEGADRFLDRKRNEFIKSIHNYNIKNNFSDFLNLSLKIKV